MEIQQPLNHTVQKKKINYNKDQIITFLLCLKHNEIYMPDDSENKLPYLPTELILYIIDFLDYKFDLTNLTFKLKNPPLEVSSTTLYNEWWPDINKLINHPYMNDSMDDWEFRSTLESTNESHLDDNKTFVRMNWEHSFVTSIWFYIYH